MDGVASSPYLIIQDKISYTSYIFLYVYIYIYVYICINIDTYIYICILFGFARFHSIQNPPNSQKMVNPTIVHTSGTFLETNQENV